MFIVPFLGSFPDYQPTNTNQATLRGSSAPVQHQQWWDPTTYSLGQKTMGKWCLYHRFEVVLSRTKQEHSGISVDIQPIIWDLGLSENGGILPQIMAIWILPLGKMSINRWILRAPYFRQTLWIGAHDLNELPVHLSCGAEHDPSRRSNHRNFPESIGDLVVKNNDGNRSKIRFFGVTIFVTQNPFINNI